MRLIRRAALRKAAEGTTSMAEALCVTTGSE
jgi:hypothetical protein